ncbi:SMI1/KNR4 family protein [Planctomyces sp. SH-PL14]|uniref:SMI1/KNR4 family protein n=1 Tax=Planctomyces sp. SH-PL14 TaxID=1632864 RepID=UPI00078E2745|nr:SMI1/KNR4 family protein [Planctomyces sp. SH-PL14]AMV20294.1 hypothetical protein VT03_20520 [Planctomyces sp. SH-PL14]
MLRGFIIAGLVTLGILFALCAGVVAWVKLSGFDGADIAKMMIPTPNREELYPDAPPMPAKVAATAEELLGEYEAFLTAEAPAALAALQPGLDDAAIERLETEHAFQLPDDLRALYRWRNGAKEGAGPHAFADGRFLPLEAAIEQRRVFKAQMEEVVKENPKLTDTFEGWLSHRYPWIAVIADEAGDGMFFDPTRKADEGAVFHCFAEDGYVFYPSWTNYLAQQVELAKGKLLQNGQLGVEFTEKGYAEADAVQRRFGAPAQ